MQSKHCRVYGQVCHSNPDMETVEDLEAEFMNSVGFFLLFFVHLFWICYTQFFKFNILFAMHKNPTKDCRFAFANKNNVALW